MTSKKKAVRKSDRNVALKRQSGSDRSGHRSAMSLPEGARKKTRIAVLIADDHSVVREGLASLIGRKADMTVVAEAGNGREAAEIWEQHPPGWKLLDLRSPRLDCL